MPSGIFLTMFFSLLLTTNLGFPDGASGEEPICQCRRHDLIPGLERSCGGGHGNPLYLVFLSGESPWTEPGGLQFKGLQRVGHNWSDLACMHTHVELQAPSRDTTVLRRVIDNSLITDFHYLLWIVLPSLEWTASSFWGRADRHTLQWNCFY